MPKTDKHNVLVFELKDGNLIFKANAGYTQQAAEKFLKDNAMAGDFVFMREICHRHAEPVTKIKLTSIEDEPPYIKDYQANEAG